MPLYSALDLLRHERAYSPSERERSHFGTTEALTSIGAAMAAQIRQQKSGGAASSPSSFGANNGGGKSMVTVIDDGEDEGAGGGGARLLGGGGTSVDVLPQGGGGGDDWASQATTSVDKYSHLKAAITTDTIRRGGASGNNSSSAGAASSLRHADHGSPPVIDELLAYCLGSAERADTAAFVVSHFAKTAEGVGMWTVALKKKMTEVLLASVGASKGSAHHHHDHHKDLDGLLIFLSSLLKVWSPFSVIAPETYTFVEFLISQAVPWLLQIASVSGGHTRDTNKSNAVDDSAKRGEDKKDDDEEESSAPLVSVMALHCALLIVEGLANDMRGHGEGGMLQQFLGPEGDEIVWRHLRGQCVAALTKAFALIVPADSVTHADAPQKGRGDAEKIASARRLFRVASIDVLSNAILSPLYDERALIRAGTHHCCERDRARAAERLAAEEARLQQQSALNAAKKKQPAPLPPFIPLLATLEAIAGLVVDVCGAIADACRSVREPLELLVALQSGPYDTEAVLSHGMRGHLARALTRATAEVRRAVAATQSSSTALSASSNVGDSPSKGKAIGLPLSCRSAVACLGLEAAIFIGMGVGGSGGDSSAEDANGGEVEEGEEEIIDDVWRAIVVPSEEEDHEETIAGLAEAFFSAAVVDMGMGVAMGSIEIRLARQSSNATSSSLSTHPLLAGGAVGRAVLLGISTVGLTLLRETRRAYCEGKASEGESNSRSEETSASNSGCLLVTSAAVDCAFDGSSAAAIASQWFSLCARYERYETVLKGKDVADAEPRLMRLLLRGDTVDDTKENKKGNIGASPSLLTDVLGPCTAKYPHLFLARWCALLVDTSAPLLEEAAASVLSALLGNAACVLSNIGQREKEEGDEATNRALRKARAVEAQKETSAIAMVYQIARHLVGALGTSPRSWGAAKALFGPFVDVGEAAEDGGTELGGVIAAFFVNNLSCTSRVAGDKNHSQQYPNRMGCIFVEELIDAGAVTIESASEIDGSGAAREWCVTRFAEWARWLPHPRVAGAYFIECLIAVVEARGSGGSSDATASSLSSKGGHSDSAVDSDAALEAEPKSHSEGHGHAFASPADIGAFWNPSSSAVVDASLLSAEEPTPPTSPSMASSASFIVEAVETYLWDGSNELTNKKCIGFEARARRVAAVLLSDKGAHSVGAHTAKSFVSKLSALISGEGKEGGTSPSAESIVFAAECLAVEAAKALSSSAEQAVPLLFEVAEAALRLILSYARGRVPSAVAFRTHEVVTALILPCLRSAPSPAAASATPTETAHVSVLAGAPRPLRRLCAEVLCCPSAANPQWWLGAVAAEASKALTVLSNGSGSGKEDELAAFVACGAYGSAANEVLKWLHCLCGIASEIVFVGGEEAQKGGDKKETLPSSSSAEEARLFTYSGWLASIGAPLVAAASAVYAYLANHSQGIVRAMGQLPPLTNDGTPPTPPPMAVMAACRDFVCLFAAAEAVVAPQPHDDHSDGGGVVASLPTAIQLNYLFFLSRIVGIVAGAEAAASQRAPQNGTSRKTTLAGGDFLAVMQQQQAPPPAATASVGQQQLQSASDLYLRLLGSWQRACLGGLIDALSGPERANDTQQQQQQKEREEASKVLFSFLAQLVKARMQHNSDAIAKKRSAANNGVHVGLTEQQRARLQSLSSGETKGVPIETRTLLMSILPML